MGGLIVTLIQVVIFLAVGFSISYLVTRLRLQQESLEAANIRLTHYASTLEQLATSRERNRLARELHDTLAHTLSGLSVQLETLKAYWDVDQRTARSILEKSLEMAHLGLEEPCAISGGGGLNIGLIKRMEGLGIRLLVLPYPHLINALGAAIIAEEPGIYSKQNII